jgi:hypothetical protein
MIVASGIARNGDTSSDEFGCRGVEKEGSFDPWNQMSGAIFRGNQILSVS